MEIQTVMITSDWLYLLDSFIESVTISSVGEGLCTDIMGYITITVKKYQWPLNYQTLKMHWLDKVKSVLSCNLSLVEKKKWTYAFPVDDAMGIQTAPVRIWTHLDHSDLSTFKCKVKHTSACASDFAEEFFF